MCLLISNFAWFSLPKKKKKYYPHAFLEECKNVVKEKKIHNYIIEDAEISFDEDLLIWW